MAYMAKRVPTTEVGSASAEMKVPRRSSRKSRMMRMAMAPPKKMATQTSWALASMMTAWSTRSCARKACWASSSGRSRFTALATRAELAPDCLPSMIRCACGLK